MIIILHIIDSLGTGGSEMMLYKLTANLPRDQFRNVIVVLSHDDSLLSRFTASGLEVHFIGNSLKKLRDITKQIQPDIIYGWLYRSMFWSWVTKLCFARHAKLIWGIRSSLYCYTKKTWFSRVALKILGLLSKSPDKIIYNSHVSRDQHTHIGYSAKNSDVIANGFELNQNIHLPELTREQLGIKPTDFVIGIVARVHPDKGYDVFLQIAERVHQNHPEAQFLLVGKGTDQLTQTMPEYFSGNTLKNQCHFLGERRDVLNVMRMFNVAVSSSHTEAFPNVVGEAMSCAIPVVVANVGDARHLVGDTEWLFEANHVDQAVALLTSLISMTAEQRQEIGAKLQKHLHHHFSIETIGEQYAVLFQSLVRE
jgi:glycosyltransferase involved in cell wall biosynthesis